MSHYWILNGVFNPNVFYISHFSFSCSCIFILFYFIFFCRNPFLSMFFFTKCCGRDSGRCTFSTFSLLSVSHIIFWLASCIVEGIESCIKTFFSKPCRRSQKSNCSLNDNNLPWFDDDCRIKRQELRHCLNLYRSGKTDENRINMVSPRSILKKNFPQGKVSLWQWPV